MANLTAEDLNKAFDEYAMKFLVPAGFEKSGLHYYKKTNGQYYAIIKHTQRGFFIDYYLAYSHHAAEKQFNLLQKKPSAMLKDYPVSIAISELQIVYRNHENPIDSPFYFYSLSRNGRIDENCEEDGSVHTNYLLEISRRYERLKYDKSFLETFIKNTFQIITNEGFKFFGQCNLDLCYKSIIRPIQENKNHQYLQYYKTFLDSFDSSSEINNIDRSKFTTVSKSKWFNSLFKRKE